MIKPCSALPAAIAEFDQRERILDPIDRVSEMCFGLFMALTFVGAASIITPPEDPGRVIMETALGCNLAWGLVDGVMYLLRSVIVRARRQSLALAVQQAADNASAVAMLRDALPSHLRTLISDVEIDAVRARVMQLDIREHPKLHCDDFLGALGVFLIVVLTTFPVALPFVLIDDSALAMLISRSMTLAMLFGGGMTLGRYAGYNGWKAGFGMVGLGAVITAAIIALGG